MNSASIDWALLSGGAYGGHYQFWQEKVESFGKGFRLNPLSIPSATEERESIVLPLPETSNPQHELMYFTLCMAALGIVIGRYEEQDRVVIHSPLLAAQQKNSPEFTNKVPLLAELSSDTQIRDFLNQVKNNLQGSYTYQDYPYAQLDASTNGKGFESNVGICWPNIHHAGGSEIEGSYDLFLTLERGEEGMSIEYSYRPSRFPVMYVRQLHQHLGEALLQLSLVDKSIGNVHLSTIEGSKQSGTKAIGATQIGSLAELWNQTVSTNKDEIAIEDNGKTYTYGELDQMVQRLAAAFQRDYNIQPGDKVGILLPSSVWGIVSMLASWQAGITYVPIDPQYPDARIRYILDDAKPSLLIADSELLFKLNYFSGQLLAIDIQFDMLEEGVPTTPEQLNQGITGYIIYTSGSTGNPKGVSVSQQALLNTLIWRQSYYDLGPGQVMLQLFSPAFDGFLTSAFSPLMAGAKLIMPTDQERTNPQTLVNYILQKGVTHFIATPTLYNYFLPQLEGQEHQLQVVTLAGEAVSKGIVESHASTLGQTKLYNEYGLTETAVCSTAGRITSNEAIHIGTPVDGMNVWVVDSGLKPQPTLVPGEIAISGEGIAEGYVNLPDLTQQKFVTLELSEGRSERFYLTGDQGRWLPNGTLEYLGRKDSQVKLRGFRIELDEINRAIEKYEGVQAAWVSLDKENGEQPMLVAYVAHPQSDMGEALRTHLQASLPSYMIPQSFVILPELPLTPNGKVDLESLRNLGISSQKVEDRTLPANSCEEALVEIWKGVLGKSSIGTNESFFDLGGDSIKAVQIAARIQAANYNIDVRDIFEHHQIKALAEVLLSREEVSPQEAEPEAVAAEISSEDLSTIHSLFDQK